MFYIDDIVRIKLSAHANTGQTGVVYANHVHGDNTKHKIGFHTGAIVIYDIVHLELEIDPERIRQNT